MKKLALSLPLVAIASCLCMEATAQNDSAWLDAGTLKLRKTLTQTISIKGTELEKMSFTNLTDAIGAWLYGAYANTNTLTYVVDGIPLGDVNGYSVYDIEEVDLVQNALMQVNGVSLQQQLVLITTRKKNGSGKGITVGAQTGLVNSFFTDDPNTRKPERSYNNFYHQYYVGINRDWKNIRYGISASYQRDAFPSTKGDSIQVFTPDHLNRWRMNGYMAISLGDKNEIALQVNYTPQNSGAAGIHSSVANNESINDRSDGHQYLFNPSVRWSSALGKGWKNELQVAWLTTTDKTNEETSASFPDTLRQPYSSSVETSAFSANQHAEHLFIRDHLSYTWQTGGWNIVPSLNASYEHIKDAVSELQYSTSFGGTQISEQSQSAKGTQYLLTPAVDVLYKDIVDMQAGLLDNVSNNYSVGGVQRVFPFVSSSTDILAWRSAKSPSSLKLFVSAAKSPNLSTRDYALEDFSNAPTTMTPVVAFGSYNYLGGGGSIFSPGGLYIPSARPSNWAWEAGASFSTAGHRLEINYNFERNRNMAYVQIYIPIGGNGSGFGYYNDVFRFTTQRLGIMAKLVEGGVFLWQSGLTLAGITAKSDLNGPVNYGGSVTGDLSASHPSWTGGWVNRLGYKNLSFGLAMLYHFNEDPNMNILFYPSAPLSKVNSLLLQNIYVGYHLLVSGTQSLELYLNSRNLVHNRQSDLDDGRRYYGIGGKMGI
jgi:hypothetical protein